MENRGSWKSKLGFMLAIIGSAIGLGNIWRFPFVAYRSGGGAFLLPYAIALVTIGIPLMILELSVGHKFRASAPLSFKRIGPRWEFLGWWMVIFVFVGIEFYYSVVLSWCINYLRFSFNLAWGDNTADFFHNTFLRVSEGPYNFGPVNWSIVIGLAIIWLLNWWIIYKGVRKGIEVATKILIPLLGVIMVTLVIWSMTLPGASIGLKAYLLPDFSKLLDVSIWCDAFSQMFFSLSLAFGIVIVYASYLPSKINLKTSAIITCLADSGFAIFAGLAVFSALGYMSTASGKPLASVVSDGPGLAFITYPAVINLLPFGRSVFGILFFLSLLFAGITSSVSIFEATASSLIDKFGWKRKRVTTVMAVIGFLGGLIFATSPGIYWLDVVDYVLNHFALLVAGLLEAVAVGWVYRAHKIRTHVSETKRVDFSPGEEIIEGKSTSVMGKIWEWAIIAWIPFILGLILVLEIIKQFQDTHSGYSWLFVGPVGFGWLLMTVAIAWYIKNRGWRKPPVKEEG